MLLEIVTLGSKPVLLIRAIMEALRLNGRPFNMSKANYSSKGTTKTSLLNFYAKVPESVLYDRIRWLKLVYSQKVLLVLVMYSHSKLRQVLKPFQNELPSTHVNN